MKTSCFVDLATFRQLRFRDLNSFLLCDTSVRIYSEKIANEARTKPTRGGGKRQKLCRRPQSQSRYFTDKHEKNLLSMVGWPSHDAHGCFRISNWPLFQQYLARALHERDHRARNSPPLNLYFNEVLEKHHLWQAVLDVDLKCLSSNEYTLQDEWRFLATLQAVMKQCVSGDHFPMYVTGAPMKWCDHDVYKLGFHVYWPDVVLDQEHMLAFRDFCVEELLRIYGERDGRENTWADVIDRDIYQKRMLRVIGNDKYDRCPQCKAKKQQQDRMNAQRRNTSTSRKRKQCGLPAMKDLGVSLLSDDVQTKSPFLQDLHMRTKASASTSMDAFNDQALFDEAFLATSSSWEEQHFGNNQGGAFEKFRLGCDLCCDGVYTGSVGKIAVQRPYSFYFVLNQDGAIDEGKTRETKASYMRQVERCTIRAPGNAIVRPDFRIPSRASQDDRQLPLTQRLDNGVAVTEQEKRKWEALRSSSGRCERPRSHGSTYEIMELTKEDPFSVALRTWFKNIFTKGTRAAKRRCDKKALELRAYYWGLELATVKAVVPARQQGICSYLLLPAHHEQVNWCANPREGNQTGGYHRSNRVFFLLQRDTLFVRCFDSATCKDWKQPVYYLEDRETKKFFPFSVSPQKAE